MSKIKTLLTDDYTLDDIRGDVQQDYFESQAEIDAYLNTVEAQLSPFTSEQLLDEYYRRIFEPLDNELVKLRDKLLDLSKEIPF